MKHHVVLVTLSVFVSLFVFYTLVPLSSWKLMPRLNPEMNSNKMEQQPNLFTTFGSEKGTESSNRTKQIGDSTPRTNLMILSPGRGGSSFLGAVFNSNPDVMYWFEPLHAISRDIFKLHLFRNQERKLQYSKTSINVIDTLFNCDFTQVTKAILSALSRSIFRNRSASLTSEYLCPARNRGRCLPFSEKLLSWPCNSSKHTVVKILTSRVPNNTIESFQGIFKQQRYNLKLIHLVRDPRAVIYSMVNSVQWLNMSNISFLHPSFRYTVHSMCNSIEKNIKFGLLSPPPWLTNRFRVIRYEDFVVNTTNIAQDLYKFAEFDWSVSVDRWIKSHQRKPRNNKENEPYALYRNASYVINKWKNAPPTLITVVEQVCGDLMEMLGYEKWINQTKDKT